METYAFNSMERGIEIGKEVDTEDEPEAEKEMVSTISHAGAIPIILTFTKKLAKTAC